MKIKLGIVMDPIQQIKIAKDSSFAMLLAAQAREWEIWYMEIQDLWLQQGEAFASMRRLSVEDHPQHWFTLAEVQSLPLADLDVILMRKDPPFDFEYLVATYILERAEQTGVLVINKPQSLRDANEKLFTSWFPHCCPPTLVTRQIGMLRQFLHTHQTIILKPLDTMGGASIFRLQHGDINTTVIMETLTRHGQRHVMAQKYLPEISQGDKRILLIDGEPIPYVLARIPAPGELRGNLVAGGQGKGQPLSARDRWICEQVGQTLQEKGLLFVGLDIIGDYLTEINVTSPTCIRELDKIFDLNIGAQLMTMIENRLSDLSN